MFTGIVHEIGTVVSVRRAGPLTKIVLESRKVFKNTCIGDSVSVNGTCLTVTEMSGGRLSFDIMTETARKTTFQAIKAGDRVNLERSIRAGDPMGGHIVTGHIDCIGKVVHFKKDRDTGFMGIEIAKEKTQLLVEKGSITIDGVSLTVGEIGINAFTVYLIPYTLSNTTFSEKKVGSFLNIEFDQLGKFVANAQKIHEKRGVTEALLKEKGYI